MSTSVPMSIAFTARSLIWKSLLSLPRKPGAQVATSEFCCDDANGCKHCRIDVLAWILPTNSSSRASAIRSVQLNISPEYGIPRVSVYINESIPSAAAPLSKKVAELPASQRTYSSSIESACCLLQMRKGRLRSSQTLACCLLDKKCTKSTVAHCWDQVPDLGLLSRK
jgi:hypothetical protein